VQRNHFFEIRDSSRIYEVWAPDEKEAASLARFKQWAGSKSHVGLRRILKIIPGEQWPVLVEESNYITAARKQTEQARQPPPAPDPEIKGLVKRFHAARIANDESALNRVCDLLIQAAQRVERARLLPPLTSPQLKERI
jgi:hypothetical protein